jgi:hypothetical protein
MVRLAISGVSDGSFAVASQSPRFGTRCNRDVRMTRSSK